MLSRLYCNDVEGRWIVGLGASEQFTVSYVAFSKFMYYKPEPCLKENWSGR